MAPLVLAVVAIMFASYGLLSHGWYLEYRETDLPDDEGRIRTNLGYGIMGVSNSTKHKLNGTTLDGEDRVQSYDEFMGLKSKAGQVANTMMVLMLIGIVMCALFIPLAFISQTGGLEARLGKWGPYIPLYVAQVAAITFFLAPIWFSYEFIYGLDMDAYALTDAPSQALGDMSGWWVVFGALLIQVAALMAISRTRLIYIEPLGEGKTPEPMK
jgi:hypothetical protein